MASTNPEQFERTSSLSHSLARLIGMISVRVDSKVINNLSIARSQAEELEAEVERLKQLVYVDQLTGVRNMNGFYEDIKSRVSALRRNSQHSFALGFVDIDQFKSINDNFGHHMGDLVLKQTAIELRSVIRANDQIYRYAGDEFIIYFDAVNEESFVISQHFKILTDGFNFRCDVLNNKVIEVSLSTGISVATKADLEKISSLSPGDSASLVSAIMQRSDKEMYKNKHPARS